MRRIVITGGSGLVGTQLSVRLTEENYDIVHLTRSRQEGNRFKSFHWDPVNKLYDKDAFNDGDIIIHLAGANIGEKRWSAKRKKEITDSRKNTAALLYSATVASGIYPSAFITSSATGIYGSLISQNIFQETDPPAHDFLGETCQAWEDAAAPFEAAGIRVVKIRTSVVLAPHGSALSKLMLPAAAGLIIRFGPGNQYFPWIHIEDLCSVYIKAISDRGMSGAYNAAAPEHITHETLMREIARQKRLPVFLPYIPAWLTRLILGEMSVVLTTGSRVSSELLLNEGFRYRYPDIRSALRAC
jgi:uncharacterized protein (TIGR01777 family)